jgi:hypothetical protein
MNRTEQKQRLSDIIDDIKLLKVEIETGKEQVNNIIQKIDDLDNEFSNIGDIDNWDTWQLKVNTVKAFIDNSNLECTKDSLTDFRSELEEHMIELSDINKEKLEERYIDLDATVETFDMSECEDLNMVIDRLDEIIEYLKGMK